MFNEIKRDSTLGIISPAWIPNSKKLKSGIRYLESMGFNIRCGQHLTRRHGYFAGTDEQRVDDLHTMYADKEVDIIMCSRGGWGGLRMINRIDYKLITQNPKPLVGYSDVTTLQLAIWTKCGVPAFSGPMVAVEIGDVMESFTENHFWEQLFNREETYSFKFSKTKTIILNKGYAEGNLLGGCLSLITSLLGTNYCPDFEDAILFLEDIGEQPYKIDRHFAHLKQTGILSVIKGLIIGELLDEDPGEREKDSFNIDEIIDDYFSGAAYPVVKNFPYGHGKLKFTMPIGVRAKLNTQDKELVLNNPFR